MRESEIAARLAKLFDAGRGDYRKANLFGIPVADIARALGVPVEPDEPKLPEKLRVYHEGMPNATGWRDWTMLNESGRCVVSLTTPIDALPAALVTAYNEHPRWLPASQPPERSGRFLVLPGPRICNFSAPHGNWGTSGEVIITAWMPLPNPEVR